jgi:hypothetical protein
MQSGPYPHISQQPRPQQHPNPNLTPEEQEQLKGVQKWAEIRKERRIAAGMPATGERGSTQLVATKADIRFAEPPKIKEKEKQKEKEKEKSKETESEGSGFWACLACCCFCSNCYCG